MRSVRRWATAIVTTAALVAGCSTGPEPTPEPTATPAPSVTATTTPSPPPASSASPTPTPSATACEPFGTTEASASSPDWSADLRTAPGDELWGVTMRVGTHGCYERWVLEFGGDADMPGWAVTPRDTSTFPLDASGEALEPPLAGTASLEVLVGAWVDGTAIGAEPYAGPLTITGDGAAIVEARILGGFEGITQIGLGLDRARPYRVSWLEDPGRLVVDVFTG